MSTGDSELWRVVGELEAKVDATQEAHLRIESKIDQLSLSVKDALDIGKQVNSLDTRVKNTELYISDLDTIKNRGIGIAIGSAGLFGGTVGAIIDRFIKWIHG